MSDETYLLVDEAGKPIGMIDLPKLTDEGATFAMELAAHCDSSADLDRITADWLGRYPGDGPPDTFGIVCAAALRTVVEYVLAPTMTVAKTLGHDLLPGLKALARGEDPL